MEAALVFLVLIYAIARFNSSINCTLFAAQNYGLFVSFLVVSFINPIWTFFDTTDNGMMWVYILLLSQKANHIGGKNNRSGHQKKTEEINGFYHIFETRKTMGG